MKRLATLLLALLASCGTPRINTVEMDGLEVGMTVEQVRKKIGPPWHLIVRPFGPETHWYVMERGVYKKTVNEGRSYEYQIDRSQYRVLELTFVDGVLVPFGGE